MAEAGATSGNLGSGQGVAAWRQRFAAIPNGRKLGLMIGAAVLIAAAVGVWLFSSTPNFRVLYTNIPDKDGGAIVQSLQQMNVPYRLDAGGMISVPADKIYDTRLKLAGQGLPRAGNAGFEIMDNQKFGVSQFAEQVNYQRAVEGELARSIETISVVEKARVHLAMPKQTVFLRDQQKPSASVLLTLQAGRSLDSGQVAGVINLVSSSIPDLPSKNVTVVDQNGDLLSRPQDMSQPNLDARQLVYVQQIEKNYVGRIQAILASIVGKDNVRAEVTAQVDFSEVEQTSETFKPNSPPNAAAIRSQQTAEQLGRNVTESVGGVPGALSNQPPGAAVAPITVPLASDVAASSSGNSNSSKNATTNYEVDKTIQHVKQPVGNVKRLSAAVVVNYKLGRDKGGQATYVPFTAQEMTQLNDLVREAIGFNKDRGDSVNIVNAAFADSQPLAEKPIQDKALDYARANLTDLLKLGLIALAVLYLLLFVVRPLMRDLARGRDVPEPVDLELGEPLSGDETQAAQRQERVEEDNVRLSALADRLQQGKELAKNDPRMVATILREWMAREEDAANPNKVG
ncbi:flagellar M-ring protein [Jeongeupia sp. HS-3]|uniref:flagellar basal-body MS-ring/collar protein FliF n=1 Tax=Jeongeupia sp. HS-3 TaxID=1009682 RepID=UPI0018A38640|nr:flagellar basal-body MS-ring/collar protein FliF [Jeongeupia sp. HS-3]BCL75821.1 flagellar M-ring protein [Jeongeupia sp. HS-3]